MVAGYGSDSFGSVLKAEMAAGGMRTDGLVCVDGARTAVCSLVLEKEGDLVAGVADMEVAECLSEELVSFNFMWHN
jgi:pseudouridine-5'-phosphate glycosidase/pseudouridine kinase